MRTGTLLILAAIAFAGDKQPEHDKLGFPITFNTERITRSVVLRAMGSPTDPDDDSVASARDKLLMDKITEHMAAIWGIRVLESDIDREIRREIEHRGGEAKFYNFLSQRGDTLARYREEKRLQLVRFNINYLLNKGISPPPEQKVLPWSIRPSPEDVRVAIKADAKRRGRLGLRVRGLMLRVRVDSKARIAIVKRLMKNKDIKLNEELAKQADFMAARLLKRLDAGERFFDVAKSVGLDADAQSEVWIPLPGELSEDPAIRFFQTGEPKTHSGPLRYPDGIVKIAYLIERKSAGSAGKMTAELYSTYMGRIFDLRREKVKAVMRLQALESASLGPEFVRKQFRSDLVADLAAATSGLRALGLR